MVTSSYEHIGKVQIGPTTSGKIPAPGFSNEADEGETSMRARTIFTVATVLVAGSLVMSQAPKRLNPMIELLAQKKPVFGLYAPANRRMGGGPGMPGPPPTRRLAGA